MVYRQKRGMAPERARVKGYMREQVFKLMLLMIASIGNMLSIVFLKPETGRIQERHL